jgi:hypothetical protein
MNESAHWLFEVEGWELGDTLGDLSRGDRLEVALAFRPDDLQRAGVNAEVSAQHVQWHRYAVSGKVVFCGEESWVMDFGLLAACPNRQRPANIGVGAALSGHIWLGSLTAGIWGEDLFEPPAPPLDHVWRVERVWIETTPWIEIAPRSYERASVPPSFAEVDATDYASDDEGRADYLLDCVLLERKPARSLR